MEKLVHTGYADGNTSRPIKVYVTYETTQNIATNASEIVCGMYVTSPSSSYDIGPWGDSYGSYVGTKSLTFDGSIPNFAGTRTLASGKKFPVQHNPDGTATATIYWKWGVYSTWGRVKNPSGSFTITLPTIPRQATITAAPNFNDEQNPTITYSNLAGNNVSSLQACIASSDGKTVYVSYRDLTKTGTSYTFSLTTDERNTLRNATPNSNTLSIKFYVKTVIGETTYYSTLAKTLSIVNANPTVTPVIEDRGSKSTTLTGDNTKIIKDYNNVYVATGAEALKGATIKSQKITCGGSVINAASGTFYYVDSAVFVITVTDSRNNITTRTIDKTSDLIPYVNLTCNISDNKPDTAGNMTVKCTGNYYDGSFGAVTNTITVEYRYKLKGGTYSDWTPMTVTKSNNQYTATASLTGLNYKSTYIFQTRAIDQIFVDGVNSIEYSAKTTPVFDWSEDDFAFNVNVTVNGDMVRPSKTLYNNTTGTTGSVTLSESANNFNYLEIYYKEYSYFSSTKIYAPNNKSAILNTSHYNGGQSFYHTATKLISISDTNITVDTDNLGRVNIYGTSNQVSTENTIYIVRVVGYR